MLSDEFSPAIHTSPPGLEKGKENDPPATPTTIVDSLLEFDSDFNKDADPKTERTSSFTAGQDQAAPALGVTFDLLVDKLLSQPLSKADHKFVAIFLCLYRKFAAPAELLSAMLCRFEKLQEDEDLQLLRIGAQLRYLSILARWVGEYPGDFAYPLTRHQLKEFVKQIARNRVFAAAANEITIQLEVVTTDDDTHWECSDQSRGSPDTLESLLRVSSLRDAMAAFAAEQDEDEVEDAYEPQPPADSGGNGGKWRHSKSPSTVSSINQSGSLSESSTSTPLNSAEVAQRQAEYFTPLARVPLTKVQWHEFMEISDENVAFELTRIDWIMYSSIRPRDLLRHINSSTDRKSKYRSLDHVSRMIDHFNHTAFWVTNMILLRDKAKHRAKMLEKFMGIAWVKETRLPSLTKEKLTMTETSPAEQLQRSGSCHGRSQWHGRSQARSDPRAGVTASTKELYETGDPHGNTEKPLCVQTGLGEHDVGEDSVSAASST